MNIRATLETFSYISTAITAGVAVLALCTAQSELSSNRESAAYELYNSYLEMAYEKPNFAEPKFQYIKNNAEFTAYTWFVSRMLFSAEQIISLELKTDAMYEWKKTLCVQMYYHKEYFKEKSFKETQEMYHISIRNMIDYVINHENKCDFKKGEL
ncbi:hypothetical protein [Aeromonas veronii]|uniref:hypothetical protein n=1 Tax=Aeromonas veronii TaxID=654 RepID=UPI003981CC06